MHKEHKVLKVKKNKYGMKWIITKCGFTIPTYLYNPSRFNKCKKCYKWIYPNGIN